MASLALLPWERLPLVHYTLRLTGHPPLVSRGDLTPSGSPDMENFGLAPALGAPPAFFMVDPWEGSEAAAAAAAPLSDSPLRYVVQSEDSIRDIVMAMLASPGKVRAGLGGAFQTRSPDSVSAMNNGGQITAKALLGGLFVGFNCLGNIVHLFNREDIF
jgi:hypothetical protein